jgi:hypothetical protein
VSSPARSPLRRFLELPSSDQRLLFEAWWRLLAAALRLRLAPGRTVARAVLATTAREERYDKGGTVPAVARAVAHAVARAAAHHLRPMTCLPRALALQRMLAQRGIPSVLRIGVRKEGGVRKEAATLAAHAWVEVEGRAVGEPEAIAERFLPFVQGGTL